MIINIKAFYIGEILKYYMNDINGESVKIIFSHSYVVKSINEEKLL